MYAIVYDILLKYCISTTALPLLIEHKISPCKICILLYLLYWENN